MSKLWAKVSFKQEKNVDHLIRAFFQDFNPESSIVVKGKQAKLEIIFRQPPMKIIDAISHCEVIELNYGKNLKEDKEEETIQAETENNSEQANVESENSEQIKQVNAKREDLEQTEQPKKKRGRPTTKKPESMPISIPELEEIAKKASSFEDFAKLVAEWLKMDKRQKFFENLVIASAEMDKITWKELEKALKYKNVFYTQGDKIWASNHVSEKMKEHSVTMLPFLNATRQYRDYSFEQVKECSTEENFTEQETEETTKKVEEKNEVSNESVIIKPRLKMECMPEIKEFEETLASVDKTQPVEDRVRYVLEAMGLNKMSEKEQKQIVEIASTAVRKVRMTFDIIFVEANIPIEQTIEVRMIFSKFVNDFVQKYESGKKVKLLTFLSELQKIIMFKSEIEDF